MVNGKYIQINVDSPCSEKVENMTPTACGAYCHTCSKEVVDFTALTDAELIDWLKRNQLGCGTFRADQLNKPLPLYETEPQRKPFRLWAAILTIASLLNIREAKAQQTNSQKTLAVIDASSVDDSVRKQEQIAIAVIQETSTPRIDHWGTTISGEPSTKELVIGGGKFESVVYVIDGKVVDANGKPIPYKRPNIFRRIWWFLGG